MSRIKNKDILKCIGVKVQEARKNKNYTQEFVAEEVDRSIDTIRGIENGRIVGSMATLINICNVLDVTLDYVFYDLLESKDEILNNELYRTFEELSFEDKQIVNTLIEQIRKKGRVD
ncbi:MAG: helix-turn-helix domain-containing protein [Clostridia bacterium]